MKLREEVAPFDAYLNKRFPELARTLSAITDPEPPDGLVSAELIAPLVAAASDKKVSVARPAIGVLQVLTAYFTAAQNAVEQMAEDPSAHVRLYAMCSLRSRAPMELQLIVIRRGLRDRSSKVREMAADAALGLNLRAVVPELEAAVNAEQDATTRTRLDTPLKLIQYGYFVTPLDGDRVKLTIAIPDGITSRRVSVTELEERGAESIVREVLERHG